MKLALTTNARLYKAPDNHYYTQVVYRYDFFLRYLKVFENLRLIAHVEKIEQDNVINMLQVDGPGIEVYEVPFPHGKFEYIKKYLEIKESLKHSLDGCDAVLLRIPDELAFQLYNVIKKIKIPLAVEVTSDPWMLFKKGNTKDSIFRPFIRLHWYLMQKKICKKANGTSYVTQHYLQERYPYTVSKDNFTTFYTDTDIDESWLNFKPSKNNKIPKLIHVSTSISINSKGHRELLTSVGKLKEMGIETNVVLVGSGELNKECKDIINKFCLQNNVELTGKLTKEELKNKLFSADIFVFPSYVEGLPRVVVEAMGAGLPCVATELPGIIELIGQEWTVPIYDTDILAMKIRVLLENKELLNKIGNNNRNVAKLYSIKMIERKREGFYKQLYNSII